MSNLSSVLQNVPLFKSVAPEQLQKLAASMVEQKFSPGQSFFSQGDADSGFYVITSGEAEVRAVDIQSLLTTGARCQLTKSTRIGEKTYPAKTIGVIDKYDPKRNYPYTFRIEADGARGRVSDGELLPLEGGSQPEEKTVAVLRPGDYCGEQAILKQQLRGATIRASVNSQVPCVTQVLSRERFLQLDIHHMVKFPERKAVRAVDLEFQERVKPKQDTTKTQQQSDWLKDAISKNQTLRDMGIHLENHVDAMVSVAYQQTVKQGDIVMQGGDLFATEFYVIQEGSFEVVMDRSSTSHTTAEAGLQGSENERMVEENLKKACAGAGGSFGEIALLHMSPREATVRCSSPSATLWVIDRLAFKSLLHQVYADEIKKVVGLVNEIPVFNCLLHDERELLAETLYQKHYLKGEFISKKGSPLDMFFIVMNGVVNVDGVLIDCHPHPKGDLKCGRGIYFGEDSLVTGASGTHTVVAHSDDVDILCLSKRDFERILMPLQDLMNAHESGGGNRQGAGGMPALPNGPQGGAASKVPAGCSLQTLERIGVLGIGGFGYVTLEGFKNETFALKKISKAYIMKSKMEKSIMNEKRIHYMCNSDFIVKLYATYKDASSLFLLIEPALGGELYHTYHKNRFHGSGTKGRFYVSTAIAAFDHLHSMKVLYRDLKPENLLLAHDGMCKMTDMGLAKQTAGKTYTSCGTPDYFAPEIILHSGYNESVDWWTVGVLTHELLSGHAPFESANPQQTYAKVRRGVSCVSFPYEKNYPEAVEFVKSLLNREPNQRLAMLPGGSDNCKKHPFYTAFDFSWEKFMNKQFPVPYKPNVAGPRDLSNFQQRPDATPKKFDMEYVDPKNGWDDDW